MSKPKTKQTFTYLGGLRKALSDLDNAIPDSAFDYDLEQSMIDALWNEINKVEKIMDLALISNRKVFEIAQEKLHEK